MNLVAWTPTEEGTGRLLKVLAAMYGQKFADQWQRVTPAELRAVWSMALSTYSPEEVQRGLNACLARTWPPTLPEFLLLCRPPVDHEAAFIEAVRQMRERDNGNDTWSHPAIFWAAVEFGGWELRHTSWSQAKTCWSRILDEKLAMGNLPAVPPRLEALPAPGQTTADPEKVRQALDAMHKAVRMPKGVQ